MQQLVVSWENKRRPNLNFISHNLNPQSQPRPFIVNFEDLRQNIEQDLILAFGCWVELDELLGGVAQNASLKINTIANDLSTYWIRALYWKIRRQLKSGTRYLCGEGEPYGSRAHFPKFLEFPEPLAYIIDKCGIFEIEKNFETLKWVPVPSGHYETNGIPPSVQIKLATLTIGSFIYSIQTLGVKTRQITYDSGNASAWWCLQYVKDELSSQSVLRAPYYPGNFDLADKYIRILFAKQGEASDGLPLFGYPSNLIAFYQSKQQLQGAQKQNAKKRKVDQAATQLAQNNPVESPFWYVGREGYIRQGVYYPFDNENAVELAVDIGEPRYDWSLFYQNDLQRSQDIINWFTMCYGTAVEQQDKESKDQATGQQEILN